MGETPEYWITHQDGQSPHLKYHLQLKRKEDVEGGESQLWEVARESSENKGKVVIQIKVIAFSTDEFREIWSSSSIWYIEDDTLINGDFPYKYVTWVFRTYSKITSLK